MLIRNGWKIRGTITHVVPPETNQWTPGFWFKADTHLNPRHMEGCSVMWKAVVGDPRKVRVGTRGFLIPTRSDITAKPYRMMKVGGIYRDIPYPVSHLFQPIRLKLRTR